MLHYTDGALPNPSDYLPAFPYLNTHWPVLQPAQLIEGESYES